MFASDTCSLTAGGASAVALAELDTSSAGAVVRMVFGAAAPLLAKDVEGPEALGALASAPLAAFNASGSILHLPSVSSHMYCAASNACRCFGTGASGSPA